MKRMLDDYLLGLPGFLLNLYVVGEVDARFKLFFQIAFTLMYLVFYPWLLTNRPALRRTSGLDQFNQPDMLRKGRSTAQPEHDNYDLDSVPNANASEAREIVGLTGLVRLVGVWVKRWVLQVVAVIWLLMMVVKKYLGTSEP